MSSNVGLASSVGAGSFTVSRGSLLGRILTKGQREAAQKLFSGVGKAFSQDKSVYEAFAPQRHAERITKIIDTAPNALIRTIQKIVRWLCGDRLIIVWTPTEPQRVHIATSQEDLHKRASAQAQQAPRGQACDEGLVDNLQEQRLDAAKDLDSHGVYLWKDGRELKYHDCHLRGRLSVMAGHAAMVGQRFRKDCPDGLQFLFDQQMLDCIQQGNPRRWLGLSMSQLSQQLAITNQEPYQGSLRLADAWLETLRLCKNIPGLEHDKMIMFQEFLAKYLQKAPSKDVPWLQEVRNSLLMYGHMEDRYIVETCTLGGREAGIFGILDGHGGCQVADYVSRNLVKTLEQHFRGYAESLQVAGDHAELVLVRLALKSAFADLHKQVKGEVSGTTVTLAICLGDKIYSANIGDSRQVLLQAGGTWEQLTVDQQIPLQEPQPSDPIVGKYVSQVQKKNGKFNPPSWRDPCYRLGALNMFRTVGDGEILGKKHTPEVSVVSRVGDKDEYLVLACDGVWDVLRSEEVSQQIGEWRVKTPEITEAEIAREITKLAYQKGSTDNISTLVVKCGASGVPARKE